MTIRTTALPLVTTLTPATDEVVANVGGTTSRITATNYINASVAPGAAGNVLASNGTNWISGAANYPMNARLTLEAGVAVSTTDQTAKTTLYLTKYKGDQIAIYDGSSAWSTIALTADISITLASLTAGLPYDVYVYSNAGTLTLELTAWTNTTTRATALTTQNGVYVKTGATTRRYLGTICITATTGQCEDSLVNRLVYNYYNQVTRPLYVADTTAHTIQTTIRKWNNSDTNNKLTFISGVSDNPIVYSMGGDLTGGTSAYALIYIYMDGAQITNSAAVINFAPYRLKGGLSAPQQVSAGYHVVQIYELSTSSLTFDAMLMSLQVMG